MRVDPNSGLLDRARFHPSPNCDPRPAGVAVDLLVVHGISLPPGEFGGPWVDALFGNALDPTAHPYFAHIQGLRVSAHALIGRDGAVTQYVPFHRRAWHAGRSAFQGRLRCNDFAVGVELEGTDTLPYSEAQYRVLAELVKALRAAYPAITEDRIATHADIAPGRKTDPGPAFDRAKLLRLAGTTA